MLCKTLFDKYQCINYILQKLNYGQAPLLLLMRLWIAHIFFVSGMLKITDFSKTIALFQDEYKVPYIPPVFAAVSSTIFELSCSVLLVLGFGTRLATIPLLVMTAVIQFTYDQNVQHAYWAMLLATILVFGAGALSADAFIVKKCKKTTNNVHSI